MSKHRHPEWEALERLWQRLAVRPITRVRGAGAGIRREWRLAPIWLRWVALLAGAGFVAMLPFEATRANAIAELWGVGAAGVVIWWVLERRSGAVQQQLWLQEHSDFAARALRRLNSVAAMTAWHVMRLPEADGMALTEGATLALRQAASGRTKAYIASVRTGSASPWTSRDEQELPELLGHQYRAVESGLQEYGMVFDQLPHVRAAVVDYREQCVRFIAFPGARSGLGDPHREGLARFTATDVASAAVRVCEVASAALVAAGALPVK